MFPKLLTLLGVLLQVGQFAVDTYVRVRTILPLRKKGILSDAEMRRMIELSTPSKFLSSLEHVELLDLLKRYCSSPKGE